MVLWLLLLSLTLFQSDKYIITGNSTWNSTDTIIPEQNATYGKVLLRTAMHMELILQPIIDSNPNPPMFQNILRIGRYGTIAGDENGHGTRYPGTVDT